MTQYVALAFLKMSNQLRGANGLLLLGLAGIVKILNHGLTVTFVKSVLDY